jgi:outer membrane protein assembly factor BamB
MDFPVVYEDWAKLGYRLDWVGYPFSATSGARMVALESLGDLVVAQASDSRVSALEVTTGQRRWSTELTGPNTRWLGVRREGVENGRIWACSDTEAFAIAPGSGAVVARERFEQVINTPPLLMGNLLIGGTSTRRVQAHLAGRRLSAWAFTATGAFEAAPVNVGGVAGLVSQTGDVLFLSPSGALQGRGRIFGGVDAPLETDGSNLYIASRDQSLWAFGVGGSPLWRLRTDNPLTGKPVFHGGRLYADLGSKGFSAIDPATGVPVWSNREVHGELIAVRSKVLLVREGGLISMLDPGRGDTIGTVNIPGIATIVGDGLEDGTLYAASERGVVAKFIPR